MKAEGIQQFAQKIGQAVTENSPTILTGMSAAGVVVTTVMAVRVTPKALRLIEAEQARKYNEYERYDLTKKEIVGVTWKCYLPVVIMGGVTIACIVGANSISLRRNAALATVYSLTEATLKEYQSKIVETLGETKARKIKDDIAKDKVAANPLGCQEVIFTGNGDMLCYDAWSGRYFRSDIETVRKAENDLNRDLIKDDMITLNEAYYALGLAEIKGGQDVGWRVDDKIDFNFSSQLTEKGVPCLVVDFAVEPLHLRRD